MKRCMMGAFAFFKRAAVSPSMLEGRDVVVMALSSRSPARRSMPSCYSGSVRTLLLTLASLLVVVVVLVVASCSKPPDWRAELAAWRHPAALPSFPLVDDTSRPFTLDAFKGEPLFIGF